MSWTAPSGPWRGAGAPWASGGASAPNAREGTVGAWGGVGDPVVVGGASSTVTDSSGRQTYARRNIFAFDIRSGAIRPFAPAVDGPVYALAAGDGDTVYAGGAFA